MNFRNASKRKPSRGVAADVRAAARYFALADLSSITTGQPHLEALMREIIVAYSASDAMTRKLIDAIFLRLLSPTEYENERRALRSQVDLPARAVRRSKRNSMAALCAAEIDLAQGITD